MRKFIGERSLQGAGIISQVNWLWRRRPGHILRAARTYIQFFSAHLIRKVIGGLGHGVSLGSNVRIQRNRVLMAEAPHAAISIGDDSILYENAKIEAYDHGTISIGAGSVLGDITVVSRHRVQIGKRFLSSWNVFIQDYDPHPLSQSGRRSQVEQMVYKFQPSFGNPPCPSEFVWSFPGEEVVIGDDVWVGANSTILKGARIGNGCVIAAGAVVIRGDYPDRSLIAGNPARVVKELPA